MFCMARPTCDSGGRILEHRLVMAIALGRPLASYELVHHLNGIRDDNHIENLALVLGKENHESKTLITQLRQRIRDLEAYSN